MNLQYHSEWSYSGPTSWRFQLKSFVSMWSDKNQNDIWVRFTTRTTCFWFKGERWHSEKRQHADIVVGNRLCCVGLYVLCSCVLFLWNVLWCVVMKCVALWNVVECLVDLFAIYVGPDVLCCDLLWWLFCVVRAVLYCLVLWCVVLTGDDVLCCVVICCVGCVVL